MLLLLNENKPDSLIISELNSFCLSSAINPNDLGEKPSENIWDI